MPPSHNEDMQRHGAVFSQRSKGPDLLERRLLLPGDAHGVKVKHPSLHARKAIHMPRLSVTCLLLLIPLTAGAATNVGPGDVSGTWTAAGSPYLVQGHLRVPTAGSLLIEPGVDVRFTGSYVLLVEGALLAAGVPGGEIHFRPDAAGVTWGHIEFAPDANGSSGLFYCHIEGANALANPAPYNRYGGGVAIGAGTIVGLDHCVIDGGVAEQGGGLYSEGEVTLVSCSVRNCQAPGGALQGKGGGLHLVGQASVLDCEVTDNEAQFIGGGIYGAQLTGTVFECRILRNQSSYHGGGIGWESAAPGSSIIGNLIASNEAAGGTRQGGGIYLWYADGLQITANTIVDNFAGAGAGVAYGNTTVTFERCLIAFNRGAASADFNDTSNAEYLQTGVWGNTGGDTLLGDESETLVADPLFCDGAAADFTLCADSPCLPLFIGAFGEGCGACATASESVSWGHVKSRF